MSTPADTAPIATKALYIGLVGIAITALGLLVSGAHIIAMAWLVGITFWTAIAIGMLLLILIHHIFDASWSVLLRRQFYRCWRQAIGYSVKTGSRKRKTNGPNFARNIMILRCI